MKVATLQRKVYEILKENTDRAFTTFANTVEREFETAPNDMWVGHRGEVKCSFGDEIFTLTNVDCIETKNPYANEFISELLNKPSLLETYYDELHTEVLFSIEPETEEWKLEEYLDNLLEERELEIEGKVLTLLI